MRRFTFTPDRLAAGRITFDRDETRHLARVLRLRPGDTVLASSGDGLDHTVRLETLGDTATGIVIGTRTRATESRLAVTLIQGVPKGDRMEIIVRAATELGVARIVPALTARTVVQLDTGRWRERARRWQRVAKEATKQCGRAVVPEVDVPRPLADCLEALGAAAPGELALCVWEGATTALGPMLDAAASATRARALVGPEGGLSADEVDAARARGFVVASLGPRILRTETAGPTVLSILQFRLGDLGA
jgi:16S rRNA (uracil1498-N3)-methyltransferase